MTATAAFAAASSTSPIAPYSIQRRSPGPRDVVIEILYCGVCHSDLHTIRHHQGTHFPCVPGHEIVGQVVSAGSQVERFGPGDHVGVGTIIDSCGECENCLADDELYCLKGGATPTYNGPDKRSGGYTFGGYSAEIVVDERFVFTIPAGMSLAGAAPLLCAGITLYSPLKRWRAGPGKRVGIIGLGGLGHIGVKIARALGSQVSVITTSPAKAVDATRLGAHSVVVSTRAEQMQEAAGSFDLLINTIANRHDFNPYLRLLKARGTQVLLGGLAPFPELDVTTIAVFRLAVAGSLVGGIRETQEMLDFCAQHQIVSDVELIRMDQINQAFERLDRGDVKYRFVIDMTTLPAD